MVFRIAISQGATKFRPINEPLRDLIPLHFSLEGTPLNNFFALATPTMSYYFAIIGTQDNPLFEYEFGTAKQGGDGIARFQEQARHMNQFIVHSSLDIVEEVQWSSGQMFVTLHAKLHGPDEYLKVSQVHRSILQ